MRFSSDLLALFSLDPSPARAVQYSVKLLKLKLNFVLVYKHMNNPILSIPEFFVSGNANAKDIYKRHFRKTYLKSYCIQMPLI